jgi:hypothetical protein
MKKSEAENFDVEEVDRLSYFRITRGKNNMTRMGMLGGAALFLSFLRTETPKAGMKMRKSALL